MGITHQCTETIDAHWSCGRERCQGFLRATKTRGANPIPIRTPANEPSHHLPTSCWRVWAEMLCAVDSAFWVMVDEDWCVTIASIIMVVCEEGGDGVGESGCCGDGLLSGVSLAGMFSEEEVVEADGGAYWNSRPVIWYSKLAISSVSQSDRWRDDNCNSPMINCWNENRWSCDMVDVGVEHSNSLNFNSKWPEKNFARDSPLPLKLIFLGLILGRCIDELDYGGRGPKTDSEGKKKN